MVPFPGREKGTILKYTRTSILFLLYLLWESALSPRSKTHKSVEMPPMTVTLNPAQVFNIQACPHYASSNYSFRFSYPCIGFCSSFHSWVSAPIIVTTCVFTCLSNLGGNGWLCSHLSYESKKNNWFFRLFCFLLVYQLLTWENRKLL